MFVATVGTFEGDGLATIGNWFVVTAFDAALVTAPVSLPGMTSGADRACWKVFFAELRGMAELATVTALCCKGGGNHFFAFSWS